MNKPDSISRFDWYAGMAMQAMISNDGDRPSSLFIGIQAVRVANDVMEAVDEHKSNRGIE